MDSISRDELEAALVTLASLISKSEKAKVSLTKGHLTLIENRIKALHIASSLIKKALKEGS